MAKKVYGITVVECFVDDICGQNCCEERFDTTRIYVSKQMALEQMKKVALIDYKKICDAYDAHPTITYNSDGTIDVDTDYYNYRNDVNIHYEVVEMELDEEA